MGDKEQLLAAGDAFVASGEIDEAIASFEAAIQRDPSDPDVRMRLASLFSDQGRTEDAATSWASAAKIYQGQGLLSEALATQKKVIEARPTSTADLEKTAAAISASVAAAPAPRARRKRSNSALCSR